MGNPSISSDITGIAYCPFAVIGFSSFP